MDILSVWQVNNRPFSAVYHVALPHCIVLGFSFTLTSTVINLPQDGLWSRSLISAKKVDGNVTCGVCVAQRSQFIPSCSLWILKFHKYVNPVLPPHSLSLSCRSPVWTPGELVLSEFDGCVYQWTHGRAPFALKMGCKVFPSYLSFFFFSPQHISFFKLPAIHQNVTFSWIWLWNGASHFVFIRTSVCPQFLNCLKHSFVFHADFRSFYCFVFKQ